jgi:hypothetical protein
VNCELSFISAFERFLPENNSSTVLVFIPTHQLGGSTLSTGEGAFFARQRIVKQVNKQARNNFFIVCL